MNLKTKNLDIREIIEEDVKSILEIYNSNQDFLRFHINKPEVSMEWIIQEQKEIKNTNFTTLVVKENKNNTIIGFVDISLMEQCYLSLIMVHNIFKCRGYGKEIYDAIESYLGKKNVKEIRIDVAYGYSEEVLHFWKNKGFKEIEKIKLKWGYKLFDAIVMKKHLKKL